MKNILRKYGIAIGLALTALEAAIWIWAGNKSDRLWLSDTLTGSEPERFTGPDAVVLITSALLAAAWVYIIRNRFKGPGHEA